MEFIIETESYRFILVIRLNKYISRQINEFNFWKKSINKEYEGSKKRNIHWHKTPKKLCFVN